MPALTRTDLEQLLQRPGKNFNDQDLTGCDLSGLEITGRDFKRAKLAGARLTEAKFDSCDFKQADLTGADLSGASFSTCPFHGARLDGATIKDATFEHGEFKGATWTGAVVKRCSFEFCDDIEGLAPHKIYRTLSDMPDDAQKLAVFRERVASLQALLGGAVEGSEEDSECALVGEFRGRTFRVKVDFYDGSPTLRLETKETEGAWFYVYRDPKRRAKAGIPADMAASEVVERDGTWLHFLSESVYLEEDSREELDLCLEVLSRLRPDTRQSLVEAMETFKLETVETNDEYIEGEYKKDILVLDLTQSVPMLLDLLSQLADVVESLPEKLTETGTNTMADTMTVKAPEPVTVTVTESVTVTVKAPEPATVTEAALVPESPGFDLTKRCRHCGETIPWGEFECPACHKYF